MHGLGSQGLQAIFLEHRDALGRFLLARGAGDGTEDLLQDIWLKLTAARIGPVANPRAYLFRIAENLMRDRHRSERQARSRERNWVEADGSEHPEISEAPSGDRVLIAREELAVVAASLQSFPFRVQEAFRLHRIEGLAQRDVADRLGVSLSTIEKNLRDVYRALLTARNGNMRSRRSESVPVGRDAG